MYRTAILSAAVVAFCGAVLLRAAPPQAPPAQAQTTAAQAPARGTSPAPPPAPARGGGLSAGPLDAPVVDIASADRGRTLWAAECVTCHGGLARGTDTGPNVVRSEMVLHDRYGSELGPYFKKGHRMQSGRSTTALTEAQMVDLAHFLRQRVNDAFRGSPLFQAQNVLTGDAKAGEAFFTGAGRCTTCHSPTGNLKGVGGRLTPIDLQQRFLFPPRGRGAAAAATAVTVTVTPATGPAVSGVLVAMDDFNVSLRDGTSTYVTIKRSPAVKVVKTDPLTAHIGMLDTLTDTNIHDVVAYMETLK